MARNGLFVGMSYPIFLLVVVGFLYLLWIAIALPLAISSGGGQEVALNLANPLGLLGLVAAAVSIVGSKVKESNTKALDVMMQSVVSNLNNSPQIDSSTNNRMRVKLPGVVIPYGLAFPAVVVKYTVCSRDLLWTLPQGDSRARAKWLNENLFTPIFLIASLISVMEFTRDRQAAKSAFRLHLLREKGRVLVRELAGSVSKTEIYTGAHVRDVPLVVQTLELISEMSRLMHWTFYSEDLGSDHFIKFYDLGYCHTLIMSSRTVCFDIVVDCFVYASKIRALTLSKFMTDYILSRDI